MGKAFTHGGQREGAGRHNLSMTVNHMKRPTLNGREPVHIIWRQEDDLPNMKSKKRLRALNRAIRKAQKFKLRVISYAIRRKKLHLLVEAKNNEVLARGLQSLGISFAKSVNRQTRLKRGRYKSQKTKDQRRKGSVFRGRYELRLLTTAKEVRRLANWLKKVAFKFQSQLLKGPTTENVLSVPRFWLTRVGWLKAL